MQAMRAMMSAGRGVLAAVLVIGLAACASAPPPDDALARAEFAVQRAEQASAGEHAPLELRDARKSLERARSLAREDRRVEARRAGELAQVEAELAEALSLAEQAEAEADRAEANLERMRQELQRRESSS